MIGKFVLLCSDCNQRFLLCATLCKVAHVRFDLRYAEIALGLEAISTTRKCRLKYMSLAINIQLSITKRFYLEVAIIGKQSIWQFEFRCTAAQKLRSVCKRAF